MEKKQTAMQIMVQYIKDYNNKGQFDSSKIWLTPEQKATELLSVEKSNIVEARVTAPILHALDDKSYRDEAEDYYNQTFSSLT